MESDNDSDIGDILDDLLANTDETEKSVPNKTLEELNFNFLDSQSNNTGETSKSHADNASQVHEADVDSSDDEDKKNFEEQKYSDYGRNLKNLLKNDDAPKTFEKSSKIFDRSLSNKSTILSKNFEKSSKTAIKNSFDFNDEKKKNSSDNRDPKSKDVYSDPIFGLRLVKPLISSAELVARMRDRKAVTISKVKNHLSSEGIHDDWVIAGVLINRLPTKTSQKGTQYCIWKLSDLGDKMSSVSLFLFGGAYKLFWKIGAGVAVGILNPSVLESKDNIDEATLSVDNAQRVMILGNSRDMGKCKSAKKSGEPCANIVNLSRCEYCVYHVKQEYKKASKRSDLQSNASGGGFSSFTGVKKKVPLAGIYSQGTMNNQNFAPIPAKRNEKLYEKDNARLALLRGVVSMPLLPAVKAENMIDKRKSFSVELTSSQMKKDLERLNKLREWSATKPASTASAAMPSEASGLASTMKKPLDLGISSLSTKSSIPRLGSGIRDGMIDFSQPIRKRGIEKARSNALSLIREKGALKQSNPNKILESRDKKLDSRAKRQRELDEEDTTDERDLKRASTSDKFKELMNSKSSHVDLVEISRNDEQDMYFNKLEIKERMEEKMMTTFKIDCKAVKCLVCKYTAYSASDLCKQRKHPLRVINAVKSFFKCKDCGNRTTSLDRIPAESCKKCGGSHWTRASMMAEKRIDVPSMALSIRGGEEKFIGSISQDSNINLLVPDSGTAVS